MNSKFILRRDPPDFDTLEYSRWMDIFRSWFWRFYDHLIQLVFYNLGWFLTCSLIAWFGWHVGLVGDGKKVNMAGLYLVYMVESSASIGWAFLIFKVFIESQGSIFDIWLGIKKFFWKATTISAVSGFVVGLAFYNIYFYFLLKSPHRFIDFLSIGFIFWILLFWFSAALYQWPILFFQNPALLKIFYRSFLLVLGNGLVSLGIMAFFAVCFLFFWIVPFLWFFIGMVFFFSFQCVVLEKHYLKYKITYGDKPLKPLLELLERERQRGWRDILRPWENR